MPGCGCSSCTSPSDAGVPSAGTGSGSGGSPDAGASSTGPRDAGLPGGVTGSGPGGSPGTGAGAADASTPVCDGGTKPCPPAPPPPPPPPPCSAEKIKDNLAACDGGTHVWNDAKTALGRDPTVQVGPVPGEFAANTNVTTGVITIAPTSDCCQATASLFFELTNAKSKARFITISAEAAAGDVAREDYAKRTARVEYDGLLLLKSTFNTCRSSWGCSATATSGYENISSDFDTYYSSQTERYKDYYRDFWDSNYRAAYQAKHP